MRIVCADGAGADRELVEPAIAAAVAAGHDVVWHDAPAVSASDWLERAGDADAIFLMLEFPTELFSRLPHLQVISVAATGAEQYVDATAAAEHGVTVCNVPAYGANAIAEHALGLLFGVAKHIADGDRTVRAGRWEHRTGIELRGLRLGVIGAGPIGARMIELGRGIGMETVAWTRNPSGDRAAALGTRFVELDELMRGSDVVSVHVPHTAGTDGLLGPALLDLMRPGTIFINTARARVVDTGHLAALLKAGRIYGVGVDVFDVEPATGDVLVGSGHAASVFSPHVAWDTPQAAAELYRVTFENIVSFAAGRPVNVVHPGAH